MQRAPALYLAPLLVALCLPARASEPRPTEWQFESPRAEIAAERWVEGSGEAPSALGLAGRGDANVDGRWMKRVPVAGGRYYVFEAPYVATNVETPARSVLATVLWFDARGSRWSAPNSR